MTANWCGRGLFRVPRRQRVLQSTATVFQRVRSLCFMAKISY